MQSEMLFLRDDVYFEPLFNHWYAWSYLIPPATASRYVVSTHRRIMTSFVNNHELHIAAVKESVVTGGDFLDCTTEQVNDIQQLIDDIDIECKDLVSLSKALAALDKLIASHTNGKTIEYLYPKVPEELSGYVELVMDLQHRPSYRLLEPLLYRSKYFNEKLQSISFGLLSKVEQRPFVLTTPRLPDESHLQLDIKYNDPLLDEVFRARETPVSIERIEELFAPLASKGGLNYRELFTEDAPKYPHEPVGEGIRLQYTGHAGFLIESSSVSILIDPVIASRSKEYEAEVFSHSELPSVIDYICITHNHQDHVNLETLLQLRHKTKKVLVPKNNGGSLADPSLRLLLQQFGFEVYELDELDGVAIPGGQITAIPFLGEHGDLNVRSKTAWLIELEGKRCFFGADSANPDISLYTHMKDLLSDLDVYAIGMECIGAPYTWLYGALHSKIVPKSVKESRRLNGSDFEQAYAVIEMIRPKSVFLYALGLEVWFKYFMGIEYEENSKQLLETQKTIEACRQIDIPAETLNGRKTIHLN